jgi:hypothetical protein
MKIGELEVINQENKKEMQAIQERHEQDLQ